MLAILDKTLVKVSNNSMSIKTSKYQESTMVGLVSSQFSKIIKFVKEVLLYTNNHDIHNQNCVKYTEKKNRKSSEVEKFFSKWHNCAFHVFSLILLLSGQGSLYRNILLYFKNLSVYFQTFDIYFRKNIFQALSNTKLFLQLLSCILSF